ncbi:major royal jelly protein 2-like isoform X2 [Apis dorsata]|uniref:major royal jelly protein 2-like isoform X2 n=1 Tax=Apis dorsata TaxID=7462 RepID=UPI0003DF7428|nr:major royal jelly protein 2-like isoform X2 [Apis dorsata]
MTRWLLLVCLGVTSHGITGTITPENSSRNLANSLNVIHEWKYLDYDFGSEEKRQAAIQSGEYDFTKNYLFDVDQWHDKTFATVIRYDGVPSSLNVISDKIGNSGRLLQPYPDWSWAKYKDCSGIVSVYKISIDKFDRLWVLDSGLINNTKLICSPKLLAFDLNTSQLLKQVHIPHDIAVNATTGKGGLVFLAVQAIDPINTMVYIADHKGDALIVYENSNDAFHRMTSNTFDYDPRYAKMTIDGESFTLKNGICGMALSPVTNNLYYSPLASHGLYYVNTKPFMKSQYGENNAQYEGSQDILNTQSLAKAVSKDGVLFVGLVGNSALGCWNEHQPLQRQNLELVAQNEKTLQMIAGMKIKEELPHFVGSNKPVKDEYMLVLSNRMQKIVNNDFNFDDVNFRILGANVKELIRNTHCVNSNNQNNNNQNVNNQNTNNQNNKNQNTNNQKSNNQNTNDQNDNQARRSSKSH